MHMVLLERDGISDFVGALVDAYVELKPSELAHLPFVEGGNGLRLECEAGRRAVARLHRQLVVDEVEVDLERSLSAWNRRRREPARGDVRRDVPRVVDPR